MAAWPQSIQQYAVFVILIIITISLTSVVAYRIADPISVEEEEKIFDNFEEAQVNASTEIPLTSATDPDRVYDINANPLKTKIFEQILQNYDKNIRPQGLNGKN